MPHTIVAVFDSYNNAQQAAQAVIASGVERSNVRLSQQQSSGSTGTASEDKGFWESLKESLGFGDDTDDRYGYREASRRGNVVVSVTADESRSDSITSILENYNAINLDEKASSWGKEGWSGYQTYAGNSQRTSAAAAATSSAATASGRTAANVAGKTEAIPVIEEELKVGKRAVNNGGIRIHSRVSERPVEEQVSLRQERVEVERRPVDRPLTEADRAAAFQNRTIEATARSEEAVVGKQARVVEEVMLNKDVQQRTQTVRDTVKRTDVDVERIEGDDRSRPVYQFADELSQNASYRGRDWTQVEPEARRSFEQRHPNSKWEEVKDTIRSRYDRARASL